MHNHQHHTHTSDQATKTLLIAILVNSFFAIFELVGGLFTHSMAILSDALHDFGDSITLFAAFYFHKISMRPKNERYPFGYGRFSLLGALFNSFTIVVGSVIIIYSSIQRFSNPVVLHTQGMIIIACIGLVVNAIVMSMLHKGESFSEKVASLHFLEDVLGWAVVLLGSIIMYFKPIYILDPILSLGISLFMLFNVYKNVKPIIFILLQASPKNLPIPEIEGEIRSLPELQNISELKIWSLDGQHHVANIKILVNENISFLEAELLKQKISDILSVYHIHQVNTEISLK